MYLLSKNKKKAVSGLILLAFLILQLFNGLVIAQITPIITVVPPYSNKLSDYTASPNKIMGQLTVTMLDIAINSVYCEGTITSLDGKIQIGTQPGHKPTQPIKITRIPSGPYLPYTLTYNDIREIFDDRWLVYKGITREQVFKNGLPEGVYRICLKVFDFNKGTLLTSNESCSNTFNVASIEAPIIIQPANHADVPFMQAQSLVFSWVTPPGAPLTTKYQLKIIELNQNGPNPVDAFRSSGYPVFFETEVTGNVYLYSPANPKLTEGKKYAFIVIAKDNIREGVGAHFRNNGASEIYTFNYKSPQQAMSGTMSSPPPTPPAVMPFDGELPKPYLTTTISGTLKYQYPNSSTTTPLKNTTIRLVVKYVKKDAGGQDMEVFTEDSKLLTKSYYIEGPKINTVVDTRTTSADGQFTFSFLTNYKMGLLDDKFLCSPVVAGIGENTHFPVAFNSKEIHRGPWVENESNLVEFNSEAEMIYADNTCKLYRYYCIEIDAPHNNFYLNPDKDANSRFAPEPGATIDGGIIVAPVRTFNLKVKVQNAKPGALTITADEKSDPGLDGVNVYILRKTVVEMMGKRAFPTDAITPLATNSHKPDVKMQVYGQTTTSQGKDKGYAEFKNLVLHADANYQYYIYVDVDRTGEYNFKMGSPNWIDLKTLMNAYSEGSSGSNEIQNTNQNKYETTISINSATNYQIQQVNTTIKLEPLFPAVKVNVQNEYSNQITNPLTKVVMIEKYYVNPFYWSFNSFESKQYFATDSLYKFYTLTPTDAGFFEGTDLKILESNQGKVVGPIRTIVVTSPGYKEFSVDLPAIVMGQQKVVTAKLFPGSIITGVIKDGDTNKPIGNISSVLVLGKSANTAHYTNANGEYNVPIMLLPAEKQKIVFSAPGYLSDTVDMFIKKDKYTLNHILQKKLRRLTIVVKDLNSNQPLKGMKVTLPEVMGDMNKIMYTKTQTSSLIGEALEDDNTGNNNAVKANVNAIKPISDGNAMMSNKAKTNTQSPEKVNNSVLPGGQQAPITAYTNDNGVAEFAFESGEDDNALFTVVITNPETNPKNYGAKTISVKIPYRYGAYEDIFMVEGGCIKGTVYAGTSTDSPVSDASVRFVEDDGFWDKEANYLTTMAKADGSYILRNVPIYNSNLNMPRQVEAMKSGSVGDAAFVVIKQSATCISQDFHLKVFADIDLSSILGFPMQVSSVKEENGKTYINGVITSPKNDQFTSTKDLPFTKLEIIKSTQTNSNNIPLPEPAEGFAKTDLNDLQVGIWNQFTGMMRDSLGIRIQKNDNNKPIGDITGQVKLNKNTFGGSGYELPDNLYLASSAAGNNRNTIKVFSSGANSKAPSSIPAQGFYVCTKSGGALTYSINGFPNGAVTNPEKSFFSKNGLSLSTSLKANIENITPSSLNIDLGELKLTKSGIDFQGSKPLEIGLGKWKLSCNQWGIGNDGLTVANAVLSTGADIQIENLQITASQLVTNKAIVHLDKVRLLGLHDLFITTKFKGFNYVYTWGGVYAWQVFASTEPGQSTIGYLQGLPGTAPTERLEFSSASFNSEGESQLVLINKPIKLFNLVNFVPAPSSIMSLYKDYFKMSGTYQFGIPYAESLVGSAAYFKQGNQLTFMMDNMEPIIFTHKNVQYRLFAKTLTDQLFIAKGTVEESGTLPLLNITLSQTPLNIKAEFDPGQKIKMSESRYLDDIKGGIPVISHQWETLRFDGKPVGLAGISQNSQRYAFVVNGAITASGQNVSVSEIPSFPGMTITYDMANSRFIGACALDMDLGGMKLSGNVNTIMDSKGWLFQANGNMEIPGIGGANLFGLFGNYNGIPAEVSSKFGAAVCLPADFTKNINGFFLSAGLTKQILPKISKNFVIVSVEAGVDLSVDARTFMKFGQGGAVFGLGVLARGHAYASGSCSATCTSASADAMLQVGVSGDYNTATKTFNIDGCASASLKFSATQCFPLVPLTGVCGPCLSVDLVDLTIGATMNLNSNSGFSMGITTSSCDQQCH